MSMALLEAMAAGLPVIVTETGGSDELVADGVNGRIVQWADIDGLETALRECTGDRGRLRSMGVASRAQAGRFSWSAITRQYLDLFEEVLTGGTRSKGSGR
jgi:glycosyltransferase involved in cell wall biosynthesis